MLFSKNRMFLTFKSFVFRLPVTVGYSQLRITKKNTPHADCPSASSRDVNVFWYIILKIDSGKDFCCFGVESESMYPVIYRDRNKDDLLFASKAGSDLTCDRKVERTCATVELIILPISLTFLFYCSDFVDKRLRILTRYVCITL